MFTRWRPGSNPADLSAALFDGVVVVYRELPAVRRLAELARTIVRNVFGTDDPPGAESSLTPSDYRRLAIRARTRLADDPAIRREWRNVLAAVGYGPESTWRDHVRLRIVPSRNDIGHWRLAPLPPHRDTWASRIMAQVNWWLPLYPVRETGTMVLWPDAFRCPVANDSAVWDFEELKRAGDGYPLLPTAAYPDTPGVPVLIEPDDLLGFSAAHLHAGRRDASGRTRFGIDSRTVWEPDRRAGRCAPDVDGSPGPEMWEWFDAPEVAGARR
ncbi:MAG: hypothetical protein F4029_14725 [Gammaproteobacteria bacterium]|nr:hypothetical protein [Gammaproteobacteria bacterium]MYF30071.1 hypothetical protein [Gammaproteobacteria bacterium]MYK47474.1 hypothetical protein [Gammaproteobacteria bacterium]